MSREPKAHLDAQAIALLLLCCALWGLGQVATKLALVEVPPLMQAAARSFGASALLLAWMRWHGLPAWQRDGTAWAGLGVGLLFALEFAVLFTGLQYTSAARGVVFLYTAPFVVALGMPFVARAERLGAVQWAGLMLAFAGLLWAFAEGFGWAAGPPNPAQAPAQQALPNQALGDALCLAAAVLWGATTLAIRGSGLARISAERSLLYQLVVSAFALALASWWVGEAWPTQLSGRSLWPLAFQTVVITFFSYLSWFWLVRNYPVTQVSAFTLLTPLAGVAAGAIVLGEAVSPRLWVAALAVGAGIAVVNLARRRA